MELQKAPTFTATEEVVELTYAIVDGWYQDGPVDWEDVRDRLDGAELADGTILDLGNDLLCPEFKKLRRAVLKARREAE